MKKKTLFMETTKIEPEQTVAEIQRILGRYGASAVMTEYDKGEVSALTFKIIIQEGKYLPFRMPCRWMAIHQLLCAKYKRPRKDLRLQAKCVAWRQTLRWVEVQMAFIATGMVKAQEVFMPYIQVNIEGKTLYEQLEEKKFKMLEDKR